MSDTADIEAPLHDLPIPPDPVSPPKPIVEMNDEELEAWHSKLRDFQTHQTLVAAMRSGSGSGSSSSNSSKKEKVDISEYS